MSLVSARQPLRAGQRVELRGKTEKERDTTCSHGDLLLILPGDWVAKKAGGGSGAGILPAK